MVTRLSDMTLRWIVYVIRNMLDGREYVGQTKNTAKGVWSRHTKPLEKRRKDKESQYVDVSIAKHGKENFSFRIVEICEHTQEVIDEAEDRWILELNTLYPNGYNMKRGGAGDTSIGISQGNRGKKKDAEWCRNLSLSRTGYKMEEAQKQLISKIQTGRKQPESTKKKRSQTLKGRKCGPHDEAWRLAVEEGMNRPEVREHFSQLNKENKWYERLQGPKTEEHKRNIGIGVRRAAERKRREKLDGPDS